MTASRYLFPEDGDEDESVDVIELFPSLDVDVGNLFSVSGPIESTRIAHLTKKEYTTEELESYFASMASSFAPDARKLDSTKKKKKKKNKAARASFRNTKKITKRFTQTNKGPPHKRSYSYSTSLANSKNRIDSEEKKISETKR